jgi:DNA invertase Pin-like site-specific DNA recombinase
VDAEKAVGYVRVSTIEQSREGVSLDAQRDAIVHYCAIRRFKLVEVCADEGVSGGTLLGDRPGGERALSLLGRRGATHIVGHKLDRLFRNTRDCLNMVERWNKDGVALHLIDMGGNSLDTKSATGELFLTMLAALGSFERKLAGERTRLAMSFKRDHHERTSLDPPYGWQLVGGEGPTQRGATLAPVQEEQVAIELMCMARRDGLSLQQIVDALEASGCPHRGARWHVTSVRRILKRGGLKRGGLKRGGQ